MNLLPRLFTTKEKTRDEIIIDSKIRAAAFLAETRPSILIGEESAVQLRQLEDDPVGVPIESGINVVSVAISREGCWIVIGRTDGFTIWNRSHDGGIPVKVAQRSLDAVRALDISSDSKWLVTGSDGFTADVWDVSTGERHPNLGPLKHEYKVVAVKFCPCGERIVTATLFGVLRVYSASSGEKLVTIPISVTSSLSMPNNPLAWFNADRPQIFAVSAGRIQCLDSVNGSLIFQWPTQGMTYPASISLSPNSKTIAYSINHTVILRDTATHQQLGDILKHDGNVSCIAFSGSDRLVVGTQTKFTIWNLQSFLTDPSYFTDATAENLRTCLHPDISASQNSQSSNLLLPLMSISNRAVKPWLHGFLDNVEKVLSEEIEHYKPDYHTFANRALVYRHMGNANMALEDARQSLSIQPSPIGQIAKIMALSHQRQYELARQEIPRVLQTSYSDEHLCLLKIIKDILLSLSGDFERGISHIREVMIDQKDPKLCHLVQANMYLTQKNFEDAMKSFRHAKVPAMFYESQEMHTLSLIFGWKFSGLGIQIQQEHCQFLLNAGKPEAAKLFLEIMDIYDREIVMNVELSDWISECRRACIQRLGDLGNEALDSKQYEPAVKHYTAVISLVEDLELKHALLLKRSKAYLGSSNWLQASRDADEAIRLNSMSPWSFECRHAALYAGQYYEEAIEALDQMLLLLETSKDERSIAFHNQGVKPSQAKEIITTAVNNILASARPHVLINTTSGRLCNKQKQGAMFRASLEYKQLVLSPPPLIHENRVQEIVQQFFRYSMLSHTWDVDGELQFHDIENRSVNDLAGTIPNTKLQMFCKVARECGFWWAWSDTCCIDKADKNVLDMSLRSMFRWYSGSSLTIVHLKGVFIQLQVDILSRILDENLLKEFLECRWNERAWTLQEYFASLVLHFYTEDWKPYLPITYSNIIFTNHKNFLAIKQGMELVTRCTADDLDALRPGSDNARQKLRLASTRRATRREDIAYALLGIFNVTIPAIYGDDEVPRALGRLLAALLTQSADVTILAWTGKPSEYNTCLPAEITVYQEPELLHVPPSIGEAELATSVSTLLSSLSSMALDSAVKLFDLLLESPPPELHHGRLKLSCIWFSLPNITWDRNSCIGVGSDSLLSKVEITRGGDFDLFSSRKMILVHPWLDALLEWSAPRSDIPARREIALRLLAHLRQPFGALLLAPWSTTSRDYKRIATEQLITVQIRRDVLPEQLLGNVGVLYVR